MIILFGDCILWLWDTTLWGLKIQEWEGRTETTIRKGYLGDSMDFEGIMRENLGLCTTIV